MLSAGGIINALTVYRILDRCRQRRFARTKLHVLEIGAGYGHVAEQLLRRLPIERYVICDLPQNLFLSSFYLQANSPEREVRFIRPGEPEDSSGQLTFLVPPFLSEVTGRFDLVINSYSFQEMSRASVDEYFAFVRSALNAEGLLYSLNAHGKSEVEWPSDYPIDGFRLLSIRPVRKFPHHWVFATNPYEMVLAPDESIASVRSEAFNLHLDALGGGFQLGLDEELAGVATRLAAQTLGTLEAEWLSRFGAFLRRRDVAGKCSEIERMKAGEILPHVTGYLGGRLAFTLGQRDEARRYLEAAVEGLSRTHARAISSLMLGWLDLTVHDWTSANRRVADAVNLVPHLRDEIEEWVMNPDLPAAAAHQLRLHDESSRPSDIFSRLRRRGAKFVTRSAR
jgi:SAM-dependent methyltransferase